MAGVILMRWSNFHTHCNFCDGKGELEEYVLTAINEDVENLGFSSHAPVPFDCRWTMKKENLQKYCESVNLLKEKYKDKIQIFLGLEIDFVENVVGPQNYCKTGLDYIIGGVHFFGITHEGESLPVDDGPEDFQRSIDIGFGGNIQKAVEHYYKLIQKMAGLGGFDILAHFDLIKKNNKNNRFFNEDEKWYQNIVAETLDVIAENDVILEVNNGGITRDKIDTLYPSTWILEECYKRKIPVILNADAHNPKHVVCGFEEAAKVIKSVWYNEIYILGKNGRETRKI